MPNNAVVISKYVHKTLLTSRGGMEFQTLEGRPDLLTYFHQRDCDRWDAMCLLSLGHKGASTWLASLFDGSFPSGESQPLCCEDTQQSVHMWRGAKSDSMFKRKGTGRDMPEDRERSR